MLTLRDIMTTDVVCVTPDTALSEVVAVLRTEAITGVPVVSRGKVVGVISASDILEFTQDAPVREEFDAHDQRADLLDAFVAEDIMTRKLCSLPSSTNLVPAAHKMTSAGVHRLLVMDEGKLVGIVTSVDFLRLINEGKLVEK